MKYLKKFNESDDKFTSRLDGGEMSKSDFEKRGDFWKPKDMSDDDFDNEFKSTMRGIGSSFNDDSTDPNLVLKLLKTCWNTDESILKSVADYFKSFDYANHFMEEYDSNDGDMDLAWDSFVSRYHWDSDQSNPFNQKFNEEFHYTPINMIGHSLRDGNDYTVKKVIEDSLVYPDTAKKYINYTLCMSLELKRHDMAKYLLSKYKNTYINSDDITKALKWVRNTKLSDSEKEEAYDLLSKYVGHIYDKYNYKSFNEKAKVEKVSKKDEIEDFIGKNKKKQIF